MSNPLASAKRPINSLKIGLARSQNDLSQAFALTYQSYFRAGLAVDNPSGLRLTPYHLLPCSDVIIAKLDQSVVSTISLFGDGKLGLPMQSMYSREIDDLRNQGLRLAEVGSLAHRREAHRRFLSTFVDMARLLAQAALARNVDALVAVVHPKHAKLYKRMLGFRQVGGHTDCPYANGNPAEALYLRFDELSTRLRNQFFGERIPSDQLESYDWDTATRNYFGRILDCDGKIASSVGISGYYAWGVKRNTIPVDLTPSLETVAEYSATTNF